MRRTLIIVSVILAISGCDSTTKGTNTCGDGVIDPGEECDPGDTSGISCVDYGYYDGNIVCTNDCVLDMADCELYGRCGDGLIQEDQGETCDGENLDGLTCIDMGEHLMGDGLTCDSFCHLDATACVGYGICGDDIIQPHEDCEGSIPEGMTCTSEGIGFGEVTCSETCLYDQSDCNPAIMWGSEFHDLVYAMTRDPEGNIYALSLTNIDSIKPPPTTSDVTISRFSPLGVLEWTQTFETAPMEACDTIVYHDNSIWAAIFTRDPSFGTMQGNGDIALVQLSLDGTLLQSEIIGTPQLDYPKDLKFDSAGNMLLVGYTNGTFDTEQPNAGGADGFILKISPGFTILNVVMVRGPLFDSVVSIQLDALDNMYVAGNTDGGFTTDPMPTEDATKSTFVGRFNASFAISWAHVLHGPRPTQLYDMALDESDRVVIVGSTFGGYTIGADGDIPEQPSQKGYIYVFHSNGTYLYGSLLGDDDKETTAQDIATSGDDLFITGTTNGTIEDATKPGLYDAFLVKYDYQLNSQWFSMFGTDVMDYANVLLMDSYGNPIAGGTTQGFFPGWTSLGESDNYLYLIRQPE